jgi:predicted permease
MRSIRAWIRRLAGTLNGSRREREMAAEFESHLQLHIDDNIGAGMSPAEARRQALLKFGGMEAVKEQYRDRGGFPFITRVAQDLRFAARLLRKAPAFSITAIVTIALGVGVNAAIFTVLNAAALQALPLPGGDRLVTVSIGFEGGGRRSVSGARSMLSFPEYETVRDQSSAFEGVIAYSPTRDVTLGGAEPRTVIATLASCNYFDVLQVRPALGRGLTPEDCRAPGTGRVVVISHDLWTTAFGADPATVGRAIPINREPFVIVGVAPRDFKGTEIVPQALYLPVTMQGTIDREHALLSNANVSWLMVIGRLRPEASLSSARAELAVIAARLTAADRTGRVYRLPAAQTSLAVLPEARSMVLGIAAVVLTAVALVLLIACANIANLLLARAASRRREIAVRMALGAGRRRLVQQLLTESLLLAAIGGTIGVVAASWSSRVIVAYLLARLPPGMEPLVFEPKPDGRVLLYALGLTVATGLAFGLVPALQSTRRDLAAEFRDAAATDRRSTRRWQGMLVSLQVAVCLVLLLSAGLLSRGLYRAHTIDPGLAMHDMSVLSYNLRDAGYKEAAAGVFQQQMLDGLRATAGVRGVAQTFPLPLGGAYMETSFGIAGTDRSLYMEFSLVTPEYFDLLGINIVRGRNFTDAEVRAENAAIVTESTARQLWPGDDPLTKALTVDKIDRPIVGIVRDAQISRLGITDGNYVFLPAGPSAQPQVRLLVAGGAAGPSPQELRALVASVDPHLAVRVTRLADNLEHWRAPSKLVSALAGTLAALALVLACTGVFGTVAYAVSRRVREIGIRVALGAAREDVLRLIVWQGMRPVVVGIALGVAGAAAVSTILVNMLFGLSPHDPVSFVLVPVILFSIALAACYVPARRALTVEPTKALRTE